MEHLPLCVHFLKRTTLFQHRAPSCARCVTDLKHYTCAIHLVHAIASLYAVHASILGFQDV